MRFFISGSYLKTNLPFSIGFLNVPAFLIFIPITTFMARIGARTVHKIDKQKISKYFGLLLKKQNYQKRFLQIKTSTQFMETCVITKHIKYYLNTDLSL